MGLTCRDSSLAWLRQIAGERKKNEDQELVLVSVPEVWRLLAVTLPLAPEAPEVRLAWCVWRRRHQHRAMRCHYRLRGATGCHSPPLAGM